MAADSSASELGFADQETFGAAPSRAEAIDAVTITPLPVAGLTAPPAEVVTVEVPLPRASTADPVASSAPPAAADQEEADATGEPRRRRRRSSALA